MSWKKRRGVRKLAVFRNPGQLPQRSPTEKRNWLCFVIRANPRCSPVQARKLAAFRKSKRGAHQHSSSRRAASRKAPSEHRTGYPVYNLGSCFTLGFLLGGYRSGSGYFILLLVPGGQSHRGALHVHFTPSKQHAPLRCIQLVLLGADFAGNHNSVYQLGRICVKCISK